MNFGLTPRLSVLLNTFGGSGGGRYIFGLGPDLVVKPNGAPSPVTSGSGLTGLEFQMTSANLLYGYYGGAYFQRAFAADAAGVFSGYGFSGSGANDNRAIQEGTIGFIHKLWNEKQYGTIQINTQASYLTRSPWSVGAGQPKNAHATQIYLGLRYVAP